MPIEYEVPRKHYCELPMWADDGDVFGCEKCGRTWVAYHPYTNVLSASWGRESRIRRWFRRRGLLWLWQSLQLMLVILGLIAIAAWLIFR